MQSGTASSEVFESQKFTIAFPEKQWDSIPQEMGGTVLFYSLPDLGPQSCIIISSQKGTGLETSGLMKATKAAIEDEFPEASFLLGRDVEQDGAIWSELIYTHSGMEFLQVLTVKNGYSYVFTATTLEELFKNRLPEFRQIFSTWRFR